MLRDSDVVRTRPRAIPLSMMPMRKSIDGFLFLYGYGAPLGGPFGPPELRYERALEQQNDYFIHS